MYNFHEHNHNHKVNIHRAPTDESVKLLKEMEEKAEKKITDAIRVQNSDIEIVVHHKYNYIHQQEQFAVIYKVNQKQEVVHVNCNMWENYQEKILKAVSEHIAVNLLSGVKFVKEC